MTAAMVALSTVTLTNNFAYWVDFNSIPATYRDLRIVAQYKNVDNGIQAMVRFNGDSGTNYTNVGALGYASGTLSWNNNISRMQFINATGVSSSEFCVALSDIMDYSTTDRHKSAWTRSSHSGEVDMVVSRWANNAAITSIRISPETNTFASGTVISLYGVVSA
jgi:hypothetical protein